MFAINESAIWLVNNESQSMLKFAKVHLEEHAMLLVLYCKL